MVTKVERLESALRAIRGPEDAGPWIAIYREAGGGYEGLQAIAAAALSDRHSEARPGPGCEYCTDGSVLWFGGGPFAVLKSCPNCGSGLKLADTMIPAVTTTEPA
jgi:hypothetical protein